MATIKPFSAIRPTRDKVSLVASRSYLSYSKEILNEKLANNPFTFLHIINPDHSNNLEIKEPKKKYRLVKQKFEEFLNEGVFVRDNEPKFYLYQQIKGKDSFIGIIGASSIDDYLDGKIKIHEKTLDSRVEMFSDYLNTAGFNAEPVLLTYADDDAINDLLNDYVQYQRPEYEFTTTNRSTHRLWIVDDNSHQELIEQRFVTLNTLYIADGHHRFASSAQLYEQNMKNGVSNNPHKRYCMSFLIAESQLKIINYNRVIKSLNGHTPSSFLDAIRNSYHVTEVEGAFEPKKKDEIALLLNGGWYSLIANETSFNRSDCVEKLDPSILHKNILKPVLGIDNPKKDHRISFIDGNVSFQEMENIVKDSFAEAIFILKAININQLKDVANEGMSMPPKSTYIEPKLRSGLLIYPFS